MLALFPFLSKKRSDYEEEVFSFVNNRFGYRPKRISIFVKALTHKSLANIENEQSNERLEFLGDAILDSVIAEMLFIKFPDEDEGFLTKIKAKIVNRSTLALIGHEMGLEEVLRYNRGRSIKLESLEGNAFEAIIGAIYLDGGLPAVKKSVNLHVFTKYADLNQLLQEEIDFKSRLFIWSQKNRLPITFEVMEEENIGAEWNYVVRVIINEHEFGRGSGSSKKKAEQAAAKETLELMGEL